MIRVTLDGETLELASASDALSSLNGQESRLLEDYLGGFQQYGVHVSKTAVVNVWLVFRDAGRPKSLDEIEQIPGLIFGDIVTFDDTGEPADPMLEPDRPLPETNGSNGSNGGGTGSEATPETSASTGLPASTRSPA